MLGLVRHQFRVHPLGVVLVAVNALFVSGVAVGVPWLVAASSTVDGRVAEEGTHDELMAAGGACAELFELQAKSYR